FVFLAFVPALGVAVYVERRRIRHAGLGVLCGFVAGTLPVASRYPEMARWLWRLVTRSGWYGKGPAEAPHLRLTLLGYYELALSCRLWILWSVIVVAIVILARRRDRAVMLFGLVAIATSIAMTARTPAARYILPAALGVVALIGAVRELKPAVSAIVFVVAAALAAEAVIHDVRVHDRLIADQTALRLQIDRTIARIARPNDVITFGWRTPQPSFALRIFARDERWIAETERLYPRIGHVNTWEGRFYLPAGATKWDLLVIERGLWPWIPNGGVRTAADVGPYIIVRPR
ncbi:MAG TPA: hypothetical protein VN181_09860, partial [Thermoanaerobaculia bacterium]|nr:hypothetical protein [Thermoanaerobaculia bacterium]